MSNIDSFETLKKQFFPKLIEDEKLEQAKKNPESLAIYLVDKSFNKIKEKTNAISPNHYKSHPSGVECIEISKYLSGCLAQAFQYVWRCGQKDEPIQELNKAIWFIDAELSMEEYHVPFGNDLIENIKKVEEAESTYLKRTALSNIALANKEFFQKQRNELLHSAKTAIKQMINDYAPN